LYEPFSGTEHHGRVLERITPRARQPKLAAEPFEQRGSELALQLSNLFAHRRHANVEKVGCARNTAFARGDMEIVQVVVVQHAINMGSRKDLSKGHLT
jgi:hypothetical protein